jgi:predicted dehydrogenase
MASTRVGIVGCGRLSELGYLPALARVPELELVAAADPDAQRRLALGVPGYESAAALLESVGVDALIVASPVDTHVQAARAAAAKGVLALVEKPPARDGAEARELGELDPRPRIGFNRRFDPALRALRDHVPEGDSLELQIELLYRKLSWRPYAVDDDALLDLGPHALDLVRWLAGEELVRVRSCSLSPARVELEAETARARATISLATEARWHERVAIEGVGSHSRGGLRDSVVSRLPGRPHPLVESLAGQLHAFARVRRGYDDDGLGSSVDAVSVMSAVDAVRRSAAAGGVWEAP